MIVTPSIRRSLLFVALSTLALASSSVDDQAAGPDWTSKHEAGRCAIRGHCGKQSFFGRELPCPDNGLAKTPDSELRKKLVDICGEKWSGSDVCCDDAQLDALKSNLKRADPIISSCPACQENFYNTFCTFTCSPDQSLFVNVTQTVPKNGKFLVTELDQLISDDYGSGFYDSCKDVKFGATGGKAMDFIGGGAKNYTSFLRFLGNKQALGSPFQINFPRPGSGDYPDMNDSDQVAKKCNDPDERWRCACVDCPATCPKLDKVSEEKACTVGLLPCLSFAVILIYSIFIILLVIAITGHVAVMKHRQNKNERLRLLQDAAPSDDEDEGDVVHNAGMLDRPQKQYKLNTVLDKAFAKLGRVCATFPAITIGSSLIVVGLLSLGWIRFSVETNPVRLWVAPDSDAAQEKAYFDSHFGPFYRAEQAFLVNDIQPGGPAPVLSYETLAWWFDVEGRVSRMMATDGTTFNDICFKPTGEGCAVESLTGYFESDFANVDRDTWQQQLEDCAASPVSCLPEFQQPLEPKMLFGRYNDSVLEAQSIVVTWVVNNHEEGSEAELRAKGWESSLKHLLLAVQGEARDRGLRLSFNTEMSLEEELNKSTNTDAKIVVVSYIIMFLYASLALGSTTLAVNRILQNPATALVQSKFMLGVSGIIIVLLSVSASVGLFSALGIKGTLIIAEVIPFLVLAVGVDNIFLIVHEFERVNVSHPDEPVSERVAKALGRMGPSILLSATTETVAFALGCFVGMPAVRNFAAYAAGAVFINALLQITMFISVLTLNQKRVEANRADCIPCIRIKPSGDSFSMNGDIYQGSDEGSLQRFIRKTYAPTLLGKKTKVLILTVFFGIFTAALALWPKVELGLDQRIALPSDSYLIPFFNDLYVYFNAGPPVYFITKDLNITERANQEKLCGRFSTCNTYSIASVLEQERKRPEVSYIADSTASWIDDFFWWLNPELDECCVDGTKTCFETRSPPWNITLYGMPEGEEFIHYLKRWITSPTTAECPLAGQAAYGNALLIDANNTNIPSSHFRTAHTHLSGQHDFIEAYRAARRISSDLSRRHNAEIFPYSKFYIFFDQYISIVRLSFALIGSALALILAITSTFLGSVKTGAVVTMTVIMIVSDIIGTMALAGVSLNAVSLVNLIISVGIGVEFCAHIARAFMFPSATVMERGKSKFRGKDARAWTALVNVGGSVFSGITVTKLVGVTVLAFTRSKIFDIYYFRIWLALVVWAATHALIFLPVALSLFGGDGYLDVDSDGGLERDLASRRYRALIPDPDEYDSDE